MLSVKQGDIKYYFWVFGMTQPGIELAHYDVAVEQVSHCITGTHPLRKKWIFYLNFQALDSF